MSVDVRGVPVLLPYAPYAVQTALMAAVVSSLQAGSAALVESPTGTGKTLCLLCATLSWQKCLSLLHSLSSSSTPATTSESIGKLRMAVFGPQHHQQQQEPSHLPRIPQIFYASRTHSQLSQAVAQLRNAGISPQVKAAVLAGRDILCVNPQVTAAPPAARSARCRSLVDAKACSFHAAANPANPAAAALAASIPVPDIEDLVAFGRSHAACPYFLAKNSLAAADIVFLPYNYLVDPAIRKSLHINLDGAIIIFDEGHNIESVCSDVSSFDISTNDLADAIAESESCAATLSTPHPSAMSSRQTPFPRDISLDDINTLIYILSGLRQHILNINASHSQGTTEVGSFLIRIFANLNINQSTYPDVIKVVDACTDILASGLAKGRSSNKLALRTFKNALRVAFQAGSIGIESDTDDPMDSCNTCNPATSSHNSTNSESSLSSYRVHIQESTAELAAEGRRTIGNIATSIRSKTVVLSFWCFNSGVAMRSLVKQGVRSIILASGTLAPLDGIERELGIPFPIKLENPHVIHPSQLFVGIVPTGPAGIRLSSSHNNRNNARYIPDLGNAILNIARIVPDGILVFFTAYKIMTDCIDAWKRPPTVSTTKPMWELLQRYKTPIVERRTKHEFAQDIQHYERIIESRGSKGAIFFAVCRGKASEGIDFSDRKARAVVMCGIPYPAYRDPRVVIKRQMMDDEMRRLRGGSGHGFNGNDWYTQQASRAVNQAIGRVIRHRNDYGAILLLDERFGQNNHIQHLPAWVRPQVQRIATFDDVETRLSQFFSDIENRMEMLVLCQKDVVDAAVAVAAEPPSSSLSSSSVAIHGNPPHHNTTQQQLKQKAPMSFHQTEEQRVSTRVYPTSRDTRRSITRTNTRDIDTDTRYHDDNALMRVGGGDTNGPVSVPGVGVVSRDKVSCGRDVLSHGDDCDVKPVRSNDAVSYMRQSERRNNNDEEDAILGKKTSHSLKTHLSKHAYKSMQHLFKSYKTRSIGIDDMITRSLTLLLDTDTDTNTDTDIDIIPGVVVHETRVQLARGLRVFVGSRHHGVFDRYLTEAIARKTQ